MNDVSEKKPFGDGGEGRQMPILPPFKYTTDLMNK